MESLRGTPGVIAQVNLLQDIEQRFCSYQELQDNLILKIFGFQHLKPNLYFFDKLVWLIRLIRLEQVIYQIVFCH